MPFRFCVFLLLIATAKDVVAAFGEGFCSLDFSTQTERLDVTAVDPTTVLPLPPTFQANAAGEYALSGLLILDGDTAQPIGEFEIDGKGDPELRTRVRVYEAANALVVFAGFIAGAEFSDTPVSRDGNVMVTSFETDTSGNAGTPPATVRAFTNFFLETEDGSSVFVDGFGGPISIPGTEFETNNMPLPDVPSGSTDDSFSVIVNQTDLNFFDIAADSIFDIEVTSRAVITIPGDFDLDGDVDGDDF